MKKFGLLLLVVLSISLLFTGITRKNQKLSLIENPLPTQNSFVNDNQNSENIGDDVVGDSLDYENYKEYLTIDCPKITNIRNKTAQKEINDDIKSSVNYYISLDHMENVAITKTIPSGPSASWLMIDCTITSDNTKFLSVLVSALSYGAGAAHPNTYSSTTTYSKIDGNVLSLNNLFKPDTDYFKIIQERTRYYLKRDHGIDYQWIDDGTSMEISFLNFVVEKDGLKIRFDPYQVAPHGEGTIEVLIPRSELGSNYLY